MKRSSRLIPVIAMIAGLVTPIGAVLAADAVETARAVGNAVGHAVFTEAEDRIIRDYYARYGYGYSNRGDAEHEYSGKGHKLHKKDKKGKKGKGMPPGLAKRDGDLPPGLQKQLERNGQLPPGLEKKALPYDLERRLPPVPRGYERVIADNKVVLIETASGIVADILSGVVLGPRR